MEVAERLQVSGLGGRRICDGETDFGRWARTPCGTGGVTVERRTSSPQSPNRMLRLGISERLQLTDGQRSRPSRGRNTEDKGNQHDANCGAVREKITIKSHMTRTFLWND